MNIKKVTARNLFNHSMKIAKNDIEYAWHLIQQTIKEFKIKESFNEDDIEAVKEYLEHEYNRRKNQLIKKRNQNGRI